MKLKIRTTFGLLFLFLLIMTPTLLFASDKAPPVGAATRVPPGYPHREELTISDSESGIALRFGFAGNKQTRRSAEAVAMRDAFADTLSEGTESDSVAENVNDSLSLDNTATSYSSAAVPPHAPAGVYTLSATFSNTSAGDIGDLFFEVGELTGGNLLLNADGSPAGVGAILSVDPGALGDDGLLNPGESFTIDFEIGLAKRQRFSFFVDAYGVLVDSSTNYTINITSPIDSSVITDRVIEISGTITPAQSGLVVDVIGFQAITSSTGEFMIPIFPLVDGENELVANLFDGTNFLAADRITVVYERPGEGAANIEPGEGALVEVTDAASPLYGTSINIPPNAASRSMRVTIEYDPEHVPNLPYGEQLVGTPAVFHPIGEIFSEPVEVTLPIDSALLPVGTTIDDVKILAMSDEGWTELSVTDRSANSVAATFTELVYSPFVPAVSIPLQPGELRITSDPAYASVYIDGFNTQLRTPTTLKNIAAGEHTLKLYLPGFNEVFQTVTLQEEGGEVHFLLPTPDASVPQVALDPSIADGMEVDDNIFAVFGQITYEGAPLNGGTAVISLNDQDSFVSIGEDGSFFGEVSLLPGLNELEVRANATNGNTGISQRVTIFNTEGTTLAPMKVGNSILEVVRTSNFPDITIVLTWDKDDTDVDMHVFDPDDNHAWYGNLGGIPGGQLDLDDTDGFGPETFTMLEPRPGTYKVNVDYYSDHGNGPTTASLRVYIGGELKFSQGYPLSDGDYWQAHEFTIGELEIKSVRTLTSSPQSAAIFTTHEDENTITVEVSAPDDVADEDIMFDIRESVEDFDIDTDDLNGRNIEFEAKHKQLQGLTNPRSSHRLTYEIVAYTEGADGARELESQPAELIQDERSQIRQEYVDKRDLASNFARATPDYGDIIAAGGLTPTANFTFAELAADSDFGPGLAVINDSINIAQTVRNAWGHPLRVTSGWRNPRRNDDEGGVLNSFHQTGDAIDLNPPRNSQNWPTGVTTYAQAQQGLTAVATAALNSSVYYVTFHNEDHVHIERDPQG